MEKEARQVLAKELADTLNAEFAKWTNLYGDKRTEQASVGAIYVTVGTVMVTADTAIGMIDVIVDICRGFKSKHPEAATTITAVASHGKPQLMIFI